MATEQLTVTDGTATGTHIYPATPGVTEVIFDDPMDDASLWTNYGGKTNETVFDDPAAEDGKAIGASDGECRIIRNDINIPYDGASLYGVAVSIRTAVMPTTTEASCWVGFAGVAADGTTLVNTDGSNSAGRQHFAALLNHPIEQTDTYTTYTGYLRGWGPAGTYAETPSPDAPGVLHQDAVTVRPIMLLNWQATDGDVRVDRITITKLPATTDYTITVTGDTTGNTASTSVTITNADDVTSRPSESEAL